MEEGPSHTFDVFRLERPPGDLWRGDARIALRARPLAVLRYLDTRLVDLWCTSCLLPLEILSESFIHDLGDRQMIEVCLASDGLDPALLDMEGSSLNAFQVQKNARILLVNPLTVRVQPSSAGAVPRYSHALGLQKDFSGVAEDHATIGMQACLRFQLIEVAIKSLEEGNG